MKSTDKTINSIFLWLKNDVFGEASNFKFELAAKVSGLLLGIYCDIRLITKYYLIMKYYSIMNAIARYSAEANGILAAGWGGYNGTVYDSLMLIHVCMCR